MECSHVFLYPYVGCLNSCFLEPKAYLSISTVNNEQPSGSIHFEKVRLCAALWRPPWGVKKNNTCGICYPLISTSEVSYSYSNTSSVSGSRWILLADGDMTNGEVAFDCCLVTVRVLSFVRVSKILQRQQCLWELPFNNTLYTSGVNQNIIFIVVRAFPL